MADSVPVQKVKDYIVKYGIEEKLSEAVNVAIKQESTDPFRVISEYLKQFAEVRAAARVAGRRQRLPEPDPFACPRPRAYAGINVTSIHSVRPRVSRLSWS